MKHNKRILVEKRSIVISPPEERIRVSTPNDEPSKTDQSFKDMVDVNYIVSKYVQTGELVHQARSQGVYADLSQIGDYQESIHKVMDANNAFMALPAETRLRFSNDPAQLISFLQDPSNYDEGVKLGLYEPKKSGNADVEIKRDLNANQSDIRHDPSLISKLQQFLSNHSQSSDPKKHSEPPSSGSSSQA